MRTANHQVFLFVAITSALIVRQAAAAPSTKPDENQMDAWWVDLAKSEPEASRALLNFSWHPKESVTFLKRKLRPLIVDPDVIEALLTQLSSTKESEWKQAFDDLQYFDPRLAIDLPTLMDQVKDSPTRQRLAEVLMDLPAGTLAGKKVQLVKFNAQGGDQYNFFVPGANGRGGISYGVEADISQLSTGAWMDKPSWTRAIRAIVLLEHINTPAAVAIIKDMATGNPDAQPTKVAKQSLARLAKR